MALKHESYLENATRDLGAFTSRLRFEDLPANVVEHVKLCVLDSLGCNLFGMKLPWTRMLLEMVQEEGGAAHSTVFGAGHKTSISQAVLVNSTACHAYELDDIHKLAMYHPGSIAVPIALAFAEARGGITGRDIITGIVAGYEVGIRAGMAATMALFNRGYHPQGTCGAVTAGATAARILGLTPEQSMHSIGISTTQAAGLMAAQEGSMVKRMHSGRAAQAGVYAGLLAEKGFTGITDVLEAGYGGFLSTISGDPIGANLTAGIGEVWETANVGFKPHACVTSIHTSLDALTAIMAEHGVKADDIASMDVGLSPMTYLHCAWEYKAQGVTAAQMNLFYGLAAVALYGAAFVDEYTEDKIGRPEVMDFISRIEARVDPEIESQGAPGRHAVKLSVTTRDGRKLSQDIYHRRGSPENPIARADMEGKFRKLVERHYGPDRCSRIVEAVWNLDQMDSPAELIALLA